MTTKVILPIEAEPEEKELLDLAAKIPPELRQGFQQYWKGVAYGIELANSVERPAQSQTESA